MRANGTPLSAYSLALDYNVKGWFFNLTGNYYDRVYIDFSSYRRLGSVLDKNGAGVDANGNPVLHVRVRRNWMVDLCWMLPSENAFVYVMERALVLI